MISGDGSKGDSKRTHGESRAMKMMKLHGYTEGQGLGRDSHGRTEPIEAEIKTDRTGLGAPKVSYVRDASTGEFPRGPHAWQPASETCMPVVVGDLLFTWSRWPKTENQKRVVDLGLHSIEAAILSPQNAASIGPPVQDMGSQFRYCNKELLNEMLTYKKCLDNLPRTELFAVRTRSNPYEMVKKGIFMNRAAVKMANMDSLAGGRFSQAVPHDEILYFADICAGPGGFSEYLTWRRSNPFPPNHFRDSQIDDDRGVVESPSSKISPTPRIPFPRVHGYGLTLTGDCDFKLGDFLAGSPETFLPFLGALNDGDITKWENLASFAEMIQRDTGGAGVHVVMADGGFDASKSFNLQEIQSKQIYLCQCLCALTVLRPGGVFVTKLFDVFSDFSVDLVYLMSHVFRKVSFVKPVTSRPANSERYLLCDGLVNCNAVMAGCPAAPKDKPVCITEEQQTAPTERRFKKSGAIKNIHHHVAGNVTTRYDIDTSSGVGILIGFFLEVNERLTQRTDDWDVLRMVYDKSLEQDSSFKEFIVKANEEIAINQCFHLSKLLSFAQVTSLVDGAQAELAQRCLKKWHIFPKEREKYPWPLWKINIPDCLREIVGDLTVDRLNNLPDDLKRSAEVQLFTRVDLQSENFNPGFLLALSVAASHGDCKPMMIFSRGSTTQISTLQYTYDGERWKKFTDGGDGIQINPRLPAATLVWALPTRAYEYKGLRKHTLTILDVAFIYGMDLRSVPYRERMERAREMAEAVNFAGSNFTDCVIPRLIALSDFQAFVNSLPRGSCKDLIPGGAMLPQTDSLRGIPTTVFLVQHLPDPWIEMKSRKTGNPFYFNRETKISTYELPVTPFGKTKFRQVNWQAGAPDQLDANQLAAEVDGWARHLA